MEVFHSIFRIHCVYPLRMCGAENMILPFFATKLYRGIYTKYHLKLFTLIHSRSCNISQFHSFGRDHITDTKRIIVALFYHVH